MWSLADRAAGVTAASWREFLQRNIEFTRRTGGLARTAGSGGGRCFRVGMPGKRID